MSSLFVPDNDGGVDASLSTETATIRVWKGGPVESFESVLQETEPKEYETSIAEHTGAVPADSHVVVSDDSTGVVSDDGEWVLQY